MALATGPYPPPAHLRQLTAGGRFPNGMPSGPYDCAVCAGAMALDAYSGGAIRLSPTEFRSRQHDQDGNDAGRPWRVPHVSAGIGLDDIAVAWASSGRKFRHGLTTWGTVAAHLRAGQGVVVPGQYIALGSWRASSFARGHMLYLQRFVGAGMIAADDPLASSSRAYPESVLQRYFVTGGLMAGWGEPGAASPGDWQPPPNLGAFSDLVSFPIGHPLTSGDVDHIMDVLDNAHYWTAPGSNAVSEAQASSVTRSVLKRYIGRAWSKALEDEIQVALQGAATEANALPSVLAGIPAALGDALLGVGRNLLLLTAALALVVVGLYLIATSPGRAKT